MTVLLSTVLAWPALSQSLGESLARLRAWQAGSVVSEAAVAQYGQDRCFAVEALPDGVFARMQGKSYPKGCTVRRTDLRYLRLLHVDKDGRVLLGEMVCNKAIATEVLGIFRELYLKKYPIESVRLIDDYGADDEASMSANNSSAFCYRAVSGSKKLSAHARGMAVDINPLYNPYYRRFSSGREKVQPTTGRKYLDRKSTFAYKIVRGDLAWRLFTARGFQWGGAWRSVKDYQHFEFSGHR